MLILNRPGQTLKCFSCDAILFSYFITSDEIPCPIYGRAPTPPKGYSDVREPASGEPAWGAGPKRGRHRELNLGPAAPQSDSPYQLS